ncbi:hypothetical protein P5673_012809 [Acropora cervicornis]|uniref:Uncharacterized protein n=1 Tax=Acropora cervicornis TaxID=6130 RepID=A0AAD9QM29_ACRCE|nr:hypothetical protein P5673_012809 [Acropora cervicornis]
MSPPPANEEESHLSHPILIFQRISTAENVVLEKHKRKHVFKPVNGHTWRMQYCWNLLDVNQA